MSWFVEFERKPVMPFVRKMVLMNGHNLKMHRSCLPYQRSR